VLTTWRNTRSERLDELLQFTFRYNECSAEHVMFRTLLLRAANT
jgi:hypothetical protein